MIQEKEPLTKRELLEDYRKKLRHLLREKDRGAFKYGTLAMEAIYRRKIERLEREVHRQTTLGDY